MNCLTSSHRLLPKEIVVLHGLLQLTDLPKVGVLTRKKSGKAVPHRLHELSDFLTPPSSKGNSSAPRPASTDGLAFSAVLQNLQCRILVISYCLAENTCAFCFSPFQALPFPFTETEKEIEKHGETGRERKRERKRAFSQTSSFSWLYGLQYKLLHLEMTN